MNNKETLIKANTAITIGDYEGFLSFCTNDTKWRFVGDQTLFGKEAVRKYMDKAYTDPPKFVVENLVAEHDFVTAIGTISIEGEEHSYCDIWRFENGKMAELTAFVIRNEAK